jgi:hypothetical protein
MGTITRTFANNITTSGVFKPTAFNNASFDNVTSVPEGAVEGGSMVLLSTVTGSGQTSISFTSQLTSTYKEYMFIFNNMSPSSNADFEFNLSSDGGSNYNVVKTSTSFRPYHEESDSAYVFGYDTGGVLSIAQGTGYQAISPTVYASTDASSSGFLHLYNPSSTTYVKHYISNMQGHGEGSYTLQRFIAGYANTTSAINGINFKMGAGNIADGTIQMFGIL